MLDHREQKLCELQAPSSLLQRARRRTVVTTEISYNFPASLIVSAFKKQSFITIPN
jgi:hypothetical protein